MGKKYLSILILVLLFSCEEAQLKSHNNAIKYSQALSIEDIKPDSIKKIRPDSEEFELKFSNIIYRKDGKEIKFPVFRGTDGDVYYEDLCKYLEMNKLIDSRYAPNFVVICKDGNFKKTFYEMLEFYNNNMPGNFDIKKPLEYSFSYPDVYYYYSFIADGIDCGFTIIIELDKNDKSNLSSPYIIMPEEKPFAKYIPYEFEFR